MKTADEAVAIEPALAAARPRIVGATYTAADESGDALHLHRRAREAGGAGRALPLRRAIRGLRATEKGVTGVVVGGADGEETLTADAYVVALGSVPRALTRPFGIDLPVYPAKGYSATLEVTDARWRHA